LFNKPAYKREKNITQPIFELEQCFLGQNGVEFHQKAIEIIKMGKIHRLRAQAHGTFFSTKVVKFASISLWIYQKVHMQLYAKCAAELMFQLKQCFGLKNHLPILFPT
jgi:hypothetical protein